MAIRVWIKKQQYTVAENEKSSIFAASIRGIRRKDDNLYGHFGRFEPQHKRAITFPWWLCFYF